METAETLEQYYAFTERKPPADLQRVDGLSQHFNVFLRAECFKLMPFRQRDYYKINLCKGKGILYTEKGEIAIDKPSLFFSDPMHQFGWRNITKDQRGFACIFNDLYVNADLRRGLKKLDTLFTGEVYSVIPLTDDQYELLYHYFSIVLDEYNGSFVYKDEMIQNILRAIVYTAIKVRLSSKPALSAEKRHKLIHHFLDMLDAQFPVDAPLHPIGLKTPTAFACQLHVHVNHLNHIIKQYTGKTTSRLIAEKRIAEAISLLKDTDWTIAEIGFSLGFEYPQYFNVFFKRLTGQSPGGYRRSHSKNI